METGKTEGSTLTGVERKGETRSISVVVSDVTRVSTGPEAT